MRSKGMIMITLLVIVAFVAMLAGAMLSVNRQWLIQIGWQRDRMQALEQARGGLNHLLHRLTYDSSFSAPLSVQRDRTGYSATFDSSAGDYSVNNLANAGPAPTPNFRGDPVGPQCADLVVIGRAGSSMVRCHAVVRRGIGFTRAAGSVGQITVVGNATVDGIDNPALPTPNHVEGGLFSKFAAAGGQNAIHWNDLGGSASFTLGPSSRLLAVPPADATSQAFSASLTSALPGPSLDQNANGQIPQYDVSDMVSSGASRPQPTGLIPVAGGSALTAPGITDERYVDGDLTINGDVVLTEGTLMVHGNLTVNGGIKGKGAIYVDGNVTVLGGNSSVLSNQPSGAALFSSGDVRLQGLDARGYLDSLSNTYPAVHDNMVAFNTTLSQMSSAANANNFWGIYGLTNQLVRQYWMMTPPAGRSNTGYWVNSIRAPNGNFPDGSSDGDVPGVVNALRASLGPAYASDQSAQRVVKALEEVHYQFHRSLDGCNGNLTVVDNQLAGVPDFTAYAATSRLHYPAFDDAVLPLASRTLDSQQADPNFNAGQACAGARAWFQNNPLDLSWIGKSYFQGVVYAQGNLVVDTQFQVLGGLASQGNITLSNGAHLIFVEEYMKLGGAFGPVSVVYYEEL